MDSAALLHHAQQLLAQGKAFDAWQLLTSAAPAQDPQLLYFRAIAATESGETNDAQRALSDCLALMPNHPGAYFQRGVLAMEAGQLEQAREAFRQAAIYAPNWADAHYNLGLVEAELGDTPAAEASYGRCLQNNPGFVQAANNLANLLAQDERRPQAIQLLERITASRPDFAEAWVSLARTHMLNKRFELAEPLLGRALSLNASLLVGWENLGEVREQLGKLPAALDAYTRALALSPSSERLAYKCAVLRGERPLQSPDDYVRKVFNDLAPEFDHHLVESLGYRLPYDLQEYLADLLVQSASLAVLDLGCGTGLAGVNIKPWAKELVGVDLASRMLDQARQRGVYDQLLEAPLQQVLENSQSARWDLLIAADVFIYVGDLSTIFVQAQRVLRPQGRLIFSVETTDDPLDYELRSSGRFAHSPSALRSLLQVAGFEVVVEKRIPLRRERDEMLEGLVVVAKPA